MSIHERYSDEQLVLPLVRELDVDQEFQYSAADIYKIPFEDLFLLYLSTCVRETINNEDPEKVAYSVSNTSNNPSSSIVALSTGEGMRFWGRHPSDPPTVRVNVTISKDINLFFERYDLCGLSIGDLRAIKDDYDTDPDSHAVSPLRSKLFTAVFTSHNEKCFNEGFLESYLFRTCIDPMVALVDYMFRKHNGGLKVTDVEKAYVDIVRNLRTDSTISSPNDNAIGHHPLREIHELISCQGSLTRFGTSAIADILHYVTLTPQHLLNPLSVPDILSSPPMKLKTIIELKRTIFTEQEVRAFEKSLTVGHLNYPDLFTRPNYGSVLEKVYHKLVRQLYETGCERGVIWDQTKLMFLQLSSPVDPSEFDLMVNIIGPYQTAEMQRAMILGFFLPGGSEDKTFKGSLERSRTMLNIGDPCTDTGESKFEEHTGAENQAAQSQAVAELGQQYLGTTSSQSHAGQSQMALGAEDTKDEKSNRSTSSESSSFQSDFVANPPTGSTSAPPTSRQIELKSTEATFTGSSPEEIEPLFKPHSIPLTSIEMFSVNNPFDNPAMVFFVDAEILDHLDGTSFIDSATAIKKELTTSSKDLNNPLCVVLKIISPTAWSPNFVKEFATEGQGQWDPYKWSYDTIVRELKNLARVHKYCLSHKERLIVPQILAFGQLQDESSELFNGGHFLITSYAGRILNKEEAVSLDSNTKNQVIRNFQKLHRSGILHRDVRLPNIAFTDDEWPTILDLGNSKEFEKMGLVLRDRTTKKLIELDEVYRILGIEGPFDTDGLFD